MGWLRDLMLQAEPAVRSFGDVARAARAHADWPADSSIHPRSLASILSKLDRGQDLDWLIDRPAVQNILAQVLATSLGEIRGALEAASPQEAIGARRLRLSSLRDARFLDLAEEPLFPGIPPEVLAAAGYERMFWYAPSGSGRSLVGQWLASRGLARFVRAARWADARAELPARGAVFVELDGYDDAGQMLEGVPDRICIAAPFLPSAENLARFELVRCPAVESYLEELLLWIDERLPKDGRFDPSATLDWLRQEPLRTGVLDGVGAALDLAGMADQLGARELRTTSLEKLARRFFRQRLSEALDPDGENTRWLRRAGLDAMLGMLRRTLTDDDAPWDASRPVEQWLALVPHELQRETDIEWLRLSLNQVDATIRPSDIAKAARRLPPGAFRTVQNLRAAGFLQSGPGDRLKPAPRWFAQTLLGEAARGLIRASPFEWGEALLRPHAAPLVAGALATELGEHSLAPIEAVLELEADDSPAYVAALEASFRALGMSLLSGADVPGDLTEALWEEQLRFVVDLPGELPAPRVDFDGVGLDHVADPSARVWFDRGTFLLSALAISEELPATSPRHALLRPWAESGPHPQLWRVYDRIFALGARAHSDEVWALAAFSLVDRLRNVIGFVRRDAAPHALELPGAVLDELSHDVLAFDSVRAAGEHELVLDALAELARARNIPWPRLAQAVWLAWDEAGRPEAGPLFTSGPHAARFWPHVPAELLAHELATEQRFSKVPFGLLGAEHWQMIAGAAHQGSLLAADPRPWRSAPEAAAEALLRGRSPLPLGPLALAELGRRFPKRLLSVLQARLDGEQAEQSGDIVVLLEALPLRHAAEVSELLGRRTTLYSVSAQALVALRRYLHRAVAARAPGFREAFAELSNIERKVTS